MPPSLKAGADTSRAIRTARTLRRMAILFTLFFAVVTTRGRDYAGKLRRAAHRAPAAGGGQPAAVHAARLAEHPRPAAGGRLAALYPAPGRRPAAGGRAHPVRDYSRVPVPRRLAHRKIAGTRRIRG